MQKADYGPQNATAGESRTFDPAGNLIAVDGVAIKKTKPQTSAQAEEPAAEASASAKPEKTEKEKGGKA